jgi:antitoxin HigA-1
MTCLFRQATGWSNSGAIAKVSIVFVLTIVFVSALFGGTVTAMRSKSLTITEKGSNPKRLPNIHPGEVLREEFLVPLRISAYKLAKGTNLSQTRISQIVHEKRGISAETALRLSKFFGNSPQFWLGLQNDYDLEEIRNSIGKELDEIQSVVQPTPAQG